MGKLTQTLYCIRCSKETEHVVLFYEKTQPSIPNLPASLKAIQEIHCLDCKHPRDRQILLVNIQKLISLLY